MSKKNVIITIISVLILTCIFAFARTTTTDLGLVKPTWNENIDILNDLNANSDILEAFANDPLLYDAEGRVEDRAGAMWTGNTETGLTITYQDLDNTIDAVIGANDIVESMLKVVNAPVDEDIFTYESTTGDFEWHTLAELSIQPLDAGLTSIAGLTTAANKMIYTTALDTYAVIDLTAFARTIIDDADASAVRTTIGSVIGTNVQAFDTALTNISALTYVSPSFIKLTADDTYAVRTLAQTLTDIGGAASGANTDITSLTGANLIDLDTINFNDATTLTIATGAVTITQSYHRIDTEASAATDDLTTISGGTHGDIIYICAANDARTVILKHDDTAGAGKIVTSEDSDFNLDTDNKIVALIYDSVDSHWHMLAVSTSTFLHLEDTPAAYTDQAGKVAAVNAGETALEFVAAGGAGETNTASNVGAQVEIYKQKTGVDLEFRTLKEGDGINIFNSTPTGPWNITNCVYDGVSFLVSGKEATPQSVTFKTDGTEMYVIGKSADTVFQWTLSTPWLISSATYTGLKDVGTEALAPTSVAFKTDGSKMYVMYGTTIFQYALSTPWLVSSATYSEVSVTKTEESSPEGFAIKPDGTKLYIVGTGNDTVYAYTLSTAWLISSATYDTVLKDISTQESWPTDVSFSSDGDRMYIVGVTNTNVYQYDLSTPWLVSSATYNSVYMDVSGELGAPNAVTFSSDGFKMYVIGSTSDRVFQYTVGGTDEYDYVQIEMTPAEIALDTLGATTDITDLDASTSAHGLMPKLPFSGDLLSTTTVSFAADADTTLYTVPTGKRCVLTHAIVVAAADAGATTTLSIGQDTAETDFIPANTLSNLDVQYDSVILQPIPNTTPLAIKSYAAATVIQAQVATQSGAAGNTIYLFGIIY